MGFTTSNKKVTFANIKWDKANKRIYFQINKKDEHGNKTTEEQTQFEGQLKEVKVRGWEYEGKPKESVQFIFRDGDEVFWIEAGWSNNITSILNTLASPASIGNVLIRLYTNKKGYASAYIEINGQEASWKYKLEELPPVKKVMVRGEEIIDDFDRIKFFKDTVIPEINSRTTNEFDAEAQMKRDTTQRPVNYDSGISREEFTPDVFGEPVDDSKDLPF